VDFDPQPLVQLRWLWEIYEPSVKLYVDPGGESGQRARTRLKELEGCR
jgi:hypothetical protein